MNTPSNTTLRQAELRGRARRSWDRRFYIVITLLLIGIVVVGFWPSYYGHMARGEIKPVPWVIHLHGAVFSGWMLLLLLQVILVSVGRTAAHRRVGTAGIAYGILVFAFGLIVTWVAPVLHMRSGEWTLDQASSFMIYPLFDMVLFGGFFGTAVAYRNKPEIHKRLILAATVALAFAAVGRMGLLETPLIFYVVWMVPIAFGIAYDLISRRRVHSTYTIIVAIMTLAFLRIFFANSEGWLKVGRVLLGPFI